MKFKQKHSLQDIDIVLFKFLKGWFFKHRVQTYILLFLLVSRELLPRIPYLNVLVAGNSDVLNAIIISLLFVTLMGFNGRKLIIVSLTLFSPVTFFALTGRNSSAELLANAIYILLLVGVLNMILDFVKTND